MKILFLHQNFPAQFVHVAPELMRRGHEVVALTASTNRRTTTVPVVRYRFEKKDFPRSQYGLAAHFAEHSYRGAIVATAAAQMRAAGYVPDVIVGHCGWGETLFLSEVWPRARRIVYAEFFYHPHGLDADFDHEFQKPTFNGSLWIRSRQAAQLLALQDADRAISPTYWQASTYPDSLRSRITVVHDGVRTDILRPDSTARVSLGGPQSFEYGQEILTFVSRSLEPYRGYHIFMRSLPKVLEKRPDARVVIVGGDGQSYGGQAPAGQSWKQLFLDEVKDKIDLTRVHFTGQIPYEKFIALMQVTRAHVYLTYPFVLSWSLLEAMSAGALVLGSRTPPVEEVVRDGVNGRLVDFFNIEAWSDSIIGALSHPKDCVTLKAWARETILERYDLRKVCLPKLIGLIENPDN